MKFFLFFSVLFVFLLASSAIAFSEGIFEDFNTGICSLVELDFDFSSGRNSDICGSSVLGSTDFEVSCGTGVSLKPFNESFSPNVSVDIGTFNQRTLPEWGDNYCVPVSAYLSVEFIDRTTSCSVLMGNATNTIDGLADFMNTDPDEGTKISKYAIGLAEYFASKNLKGHSVDVEMDVYRKGIGSGFVQENGFSYERVNNAISRTQLLQELQNGTTIFFAIKESEGLVGHAMSLSGMSTDKLPNGRYKVEFSDPWRDKKITMEMDDKGRVYDSKGEMFVQQEVIVLKKN